jgi:hypothetical protein
MSDLKAPDAIDDFPAPAEEPLRTAFSKLAPRIQASAAPRSLEEEIEGHTA